MILFLLIKGQGEKITDVWYHTKISLQNGVEPTTVLSTVVYSVAL